MNSTVCSLRLSKPLPNKRSNWSSVTYRIKWEALEDKEVRKQFASSISSKFRQLPNISEDIEREWLLFRSAIISSAAESCGRKRLGMAGDNEKNQIKSNLFFEDARQIRYDNIAYSRTSSGKHGKARRLKTYKIISIIDEINYVIAVWP